MENFPSGFRAIVFGASGGIGGAFVQALQADPACAAVVGLGRATEPTVDLESESSIENAAAALKEDGPWHLMIDATGLLHDKAMQPEKALSAIDPEQVARSFVVNATGPLLLLKHFHRLLPRSGRAVFASLSARVGSISDNGLGGWYAYRASKAALNMFLQTAAIEIARKRPDAVCMALHPGTVETRLSDPFSGSRERFAPAETAAKLLEVIDTAEPDEGAQFRAYDGSRIGW
jgi:NAD(P)-dependent dehydrogenase (short-subunit alcohol dehydrogenase family)